MNIRDKRITKELYEIMENPLDYIYIDYDENDMTKLQILFIGPRNTPYSRMFLRFEWIYSDDYPIKPPKITFISSYNKKIHPNIFPGGYVCLSTLNRGDDSGWVPSLSLRTILATLYSMLNAEMIQSSDNTHTHEMSSDFFPGIMHDTFYITIKLLTEEKNAMFKKIMNDYVLTHKNWYIRKLEKLSKRYDNKILKFYYDNIFSNNKSANFASFIDQLNHIQ